jgi:ADP-ribose pyrophosphatase YjhB (NUDIX family)
MYHIYFGNRYIALYAQDEDTLGNNSTNYIFCKNKKSFDKAYNEFKKDEDITFLNIISPDIDILFKHLVKKFKTIKAAGGLVVNRKGETLIIKRNGVWDLPKGKIEKGEKKRAAAIREVQEECGIKELSIVSKIGKSYHTYNLKNKPMLKVTHWYLMNYLGNGTPIPQTSEGISEIIWSNDEELSRISELTHPNLKTIFKIKLKT